MRGSFALWRGANLGRFWAVERVVLMPPLPRDCEKVNGVAEKGERRKVVSRTLLGAWLVPPREELSRPKTCQGAAQRMIGDLGGTIYPWGGRGGWVGPASPNHQCHFKEW